MKNVPSRFSLAVRGLAAAIPLRPYPPTTTSRGEVRELKLNILNRRRSVPHLGRKLYHMAMGTICFALYAFVLDRHQALLALASVGGTFVALDLIRLRFPRANELTLRLFGGLMRREELKRLSGNSFFVLGLTLITFLFPRPVVLLSVLYLAWGDPAAAIVGTLYGRRRIPGGKSLEGALANFAVCALATLGLALFHFRWTPDHALLFAALGGAVATVSELAPLPVDDNFSIPVLSAVQLSILLLLMGW